MPIFFSPKIYKKKCILLISGYRDIPYIWSEILPYFKNDNIDYYAPRTHGNGRSFFQDVEPEDWVITYIEAIYLLQNIYEEIDIIAFSTGCVIALYISQFNFKCKINNIILCAPFLLKNETFTDYLVFNSYLSYIINPILNFIVSLRIKTPEIGFKYVRDTHNHQIAQIDFYELCGFIKLETKLMKFKNLRPKSINANNITILYANDDKIIGDIYKQRDIIYNIFKKDIPIISIPSDSNLKCGHVMFKETPDIIENIYLHIKNIIF
jgi:esterase/lipase